MKKLNLGCGRDIKSNYLNVDSVKLPGVDKVINLDKYPWPFRDNEFEEICCFNVLEHLNSIISPLEELWRISKSRGKIKIQVPIFPGIYAMCDPTHKQFYTYMTWDYFEPNNKGLNYYSKAKFKVLKRKIRFHPTLKFMEGVNFSRFTQKIYAAFFSFLIPATLLDIELEVVK